MISEARMTHSLAVARLVVELAKQHGTYSDEQLQELFIMGYLHDIGYEFVIDPYAHSIVGGEVLRRSGFVHWQEIAHHGLPESEYSSHALDLLNAADMHTLPTGEHVSFEQRLTDIVERYGEDSVPYRNASAIIEQLKLKGYC